MVFFQLDDEMCTGFHDNNKTKQNQQLWELVRGWKGKGMMVQGYRVKEHAWGVGG